MSRGKHLSLEEARKESKLDQFVAEHPSEGDENAFNALLENMVKNKKKAESPN
jgi:hypothetical protein